MEALKGSVLRKDPFEYLIVAGLLDPARQSEVLKDFPKLPSAGSFALSGLSYGQSFRSILSELTSGRFPEALGEKLGMELSQYPTMATVRGKSRPKDGKIHADNPSKLVTLLLYLGGTDEAREGRLRLLNSPTDIDAYAEEVAPDYGTMLVFKNAPNAWHGFRSYAGERRVIQVNWVTDLQYARREEARHSLSALVKTLLPLRAN